VAGAERVAPVQAMGPLAYRVERPRQGGVLLVGDAAGFYDPLTGEGVFSGLRAAELAAETVAAAWRAGDWSARTLGTYDTARQQIFTAKARFIYALHFVLRHRRLANVTAHILARRPGLMDVVLGIVGDYVPPSALFRTAVSSADAASTP
jgi:flavin-dependent dehydrogenase